MTARWITTPEEFAAVAPAWDRGVEAAGGGNPYLLSEFLLAWAEAFVPRGELRVLACVEDGAVVGGLPLYRVRRWPGVPVLRMVGCGVANLTEAFFVGAASAASAADALRELGGWRYLTLGLARGPLLAPQVRLRQTVHSAGAAARIALDPGQGAAAYLETLTLKMRTNIRRRVRLAEAAGGAELRRTADGDELDELIEFQLRHNDPARQSARELGFVPPPTWRRYYRDAINRLGRRGHLDAMGLRIGGELAAAGFGIRYGPGYKSLLTSYDPRFRRLGPGTVFLYHLIDWCARHGDPYLDLYPDAQEAIAQRWCNRREPLYRVRVFPDTAAGRVLSWFGRRRP